MIELLKDISIRCNKCGKIITIGKEEIDFDLCVYDHGENGMGEETEFRHEGCVKCDKCSNEISFTIFGWEYPAGAFNNEDFKITGGEFEEEPHIGVIYFRYDFDPEDAYTEYLRIKQLIGQMNIDQVIMNIDRHQELIYDITPRKFEEVIERLLQDNGFETELTKMTRDGGKDIIATKYEMGKPIAFYIECKRYDRKNNVDVKIVRELYGVQSANNINTAFLVTTGNVTKDAQEFVKKQGKRMSIINADDIADFIHKSAERYRKIQLQRIIKSGES